MKTFITTFQDGYESLDLAPTKSLAIVAATGPRVATGENLIVDSVHEVFNPPKKLRNGREMHHSPNLIQVPWKASAFADMSKQNSPDQRP